MVLVNTVGFRVWGVGFMGFMVWGVGFMGFMVSGLGSGVDRVVGSATITAMTPILYDSAP